LNQEEKEEKALLAAQERVLRASQARPFDLAEMSAAQDAQLAAERTLAMSCGNEAAMPISWQPAWNTGAPLPHLIAGGGRIVLLYLVQVPDPSWDGTYATMKDPSSSSSESIAIVEFERVTAHRFGTPNDEVLHGHPLFGRGLRAYGAHKVVNSTWLAELQRINSVHAGYDPAHWSDRVHYLLSFHDETFECIAGSHAVEVVEATFREALALASAKVLR
jgi:hypothetical protein